MAKWVRVDDNPDEPIRINLVVDRKKHPKIAQWYTSIQYGKASDEIRKALEFYIDHGQGKAPLPSSVPDHAVATPLPVAPAAPAPPEGAVISDGAAGVLDVLENSF